MINKIILNASFIMIQFKLLSKGSMYPYVILKSEQIYYCPGQHINSSNHLLRISNFNVIYGFL